MRCHLKELNSARIDAQKTYYDDLWNTEFCLVFSKMKAEKGIWLFSINALRRDELFMLYYDINTRKMYKPAMTKFKLGDLQNGFKPSELWGSGAAPQ